MTQRVLYEAVDFPIFQNRMYDTVEAAHACPRGQIRIVEDQKTGLVYNAAFDPDLMVYDAAYQNEQGNSVPFRAHLNWAADLVRATMGDRLIEVGCGKGTFLEMLAERGADITGFDPTYEGDDPRIEKLYFGPDVGMNGDGLVLRHVLEHIQNPVDFLMQLAEANGGQGLIYIEVPCLDWICDNRAWFDLFYEHVNYFRLDDFYKIFGRVVEAGNCFGGQYLYVVADLATLKKPVYDDENTVSFPDDFTDSLTAANSSDHDVVWGGASKGLIFSMLRARAGRPVAGVIDINPAKQGKFLAGTGLRVSAPNELLPNLSPEARILVMNPNYTKEIKEMSGNAFTYVEVGK
ncbi:methyltransferase domain-containing protein [Rhodobacteraceae bacterium M382]|nr:methyltransferase domain-containing protein [Rhodobacteraceae bacterium M382]